MYSRWQETRVPVQPRGPSGGHQESPRAGHVLPSAIARVAPPSVPTALGHTHSLLSPRAAESRRAASAVRLSRESPAGLQREPPAWAWAWTRRATPWEGRCWASARRRVPLEAPSLRRDLS